MHAVVISIFSFYFYSTIITVSNGIHIFLFPFTQCVYNHDMLTINHLNYMQTHTHPFIHLYTIQILPLPSWMKTNLWHVQVIPAWRPRSHSHPPFINVYISMFAHFIYCFTWRVFTLNSVIVTACLHIVRSLPRKCIFKYTLCGHSVKGFYFFLLFFFEWMDEGDELHIYTVYFILHATREVEQFRKG